MLFSMWRSSSSALSFGGCTFNLRLNIGKKEKAWFFSCFFTTMPHSSIHITVKIAQIHLSLTGFFLLFMNETLRQRKTAFVRDLHFTGHLFPINNQITSYSAPKPLQCTYCHDLKLLTEPHQPQKQGKNLDVLLFSFAKTKQALRKKLD